MVEKAESNGEVRVFKDCLPVREMKVGENKSTSLNIDDYSYRAAGQRFAEKYLRTREEMGDMKNWMFNVLYFFLGAFVWEFIPEITQFLMMIWGYV